MENHIVKVHIYFRVRRAVRILLSHSSVHTFILNFHNAFIGEIFSPNIIETDFSHGK
jgi:hypothetical protein